MSDRLDTANLPRIMGILNVTPDSFSDGGRYLDSSAAFDRAAEMLEEGADIIDIGAESTRPGAEPVPADVQMARVLPVIEGLAAIRPQPVLSIDTRSALVAEAALSAGASMVNDISALRDDAELAGVVARRGASLVLMHMKGTPADMQRGGGPHYDDVVEEVRAFLRERADFARARGVPDASIIIDPGLGFGKRYEDNLALLRGIARLRELGYPVLIGASRKSFIGRALDQPEPKDRLVGSLVVAVLAALDGAAILRVHDVAPTVQALRMLRAIRPDRERLPPWGPPGRPVS
jgi:dihydropteroate synthase